MTTKRLFFLAAAASLALFSACKEVEDPFLLPVEEDAAFYPLHIGKYWEYELDSIIYTLNSIDTAFLWVREEVVDTFLDLNGRPWYLVERYERADTLQPWNIRLVFAAAIHGKEALRLENDLTFVKLLFPLTPFKKWNGNQYFDPTITITIAAESLEMFKGWEYRVLGDAQPDTVNGVLYPEVVHIRQADVDNLLERRYAHEKYARGVGLIERELRILDTQQIDDAIPWEIKAEKGFILFQRLIESN